MKYKVMVEVIVETDKFQHDYLKNLEPNDKALQGVEDVIDRCDLGLQDGVVTVNVIDAVPDPLEAEACREDEEVDWSDPNNWTDGVPGTVELRTLNVLDLHVEHPAENGALGYAVREHPAEGWQAFSYNRGWTKWNVKPISLDRVVLYEDTWAEPENVHELEA